MFSAVRYLNDLLDQPVKDDLEKNGYIGHHHGLGTYLRNELKLWDENSQVSQFYNKVYGITHADDISSMIMQEYVCYLRREEYDPFRDVNKFLDHWKEFSSVQW